MISLTSVEAGFFTAENWENIWESVVTWFLSFGKNILIALIVLLVGLKLIKWVLKLIGRSLSKTRIEPIVVKFLNSLIKFGLYAVLVIIIIGILGIPTSSFIAALSAAGLTIGLALQGSLSNFAGGVLILIFKPFAIGDYISEDTNKNEGVVTGIDLFYTKLLTIDNKTVVIPNGTLANASLTNYTAQKKRRIDLKFGIAYEADLRKAKEILRSVVDSETGILKDEPVSLYVDALEESQVTLGVRVWVATDDYWQVRWNLTENAKLALDDAGIEIPFRQVTVSYKEDKRGEEKE